MAKLVFLAALTLAAAAANNDTNACSSINDFAGGLLPTHGSVDSSGSDGTGTFGNNDGNDGGPPANMWLMADLHHIDLALCRPKSTLDTFVAHKSAPECWHGSVR